jgi:hypothetical protein
VKNKINTLNKILKTHKINNKKKEAIINDYLVELIPAGTKGVIRGNKFNDIVMKTIINMHLDNKRFKVCFEEHCSIIDTSERPDWYILDITNNRVLIGMNQIDLWSGGHQLNRGSKYIIK